MRFHARSVGRSSAVASSCPNQAHQQTNQTTRGGRTECTHSEGVPYARERLWDDVQHAHATMQERYVVVAHVSETTVRRAAWAEEAVAECCGVDEPCCAEARLGVYERVEEPGGVGEVGAHVGVRGAEEVEKDEVLDGG